MSITLNDVPQELCIRIVQYFKHDPQTLFNLCLTSLRFVDEAQSHLYAFVHVIDSHLYNPSLPSISLANFQKLLSTFTVHNPSLAKFVKAFIYTYQPPKDDPSHEDLRHALRLMINVKWLELNTRIPRIPQIFFQGCAFQLHHFRCTFTSSDGAAIYNLLSTQRALRSLHIYGLSPDFPSDCCTSLKSLFVEDWRNLLQVLPGRSVFGLELLHVGPFFDSVPSSITAELGNLTYFTFASHTPYDFLKIVAPYLTQLTVLRIIGGERIGQSGEILSENLVILCQLPNLERFIWSSEDYYQSHRDRLDVAKDLHDEAAVLVDMWFQMPKLELAYSRAYDYEHTADHHACWKKDRELRWEYPEVASGRKPYFVK